MTRYQILVCFLLSWILKASGSHFRGALITWAPTGKGTEISISYQISWRSDYGDGYRCDDIRVQNQTTLRGEGDMECFSACTMSQPLRFNCTGFDLDNNWSTGRNTFRYDPGTSGVIKFGYQGVNWASLTVGGGGTWRLVVTADTRVRPDTGKINSSPTVDVKPVLDVQYSCRNGFQLPVNDPDGDIVRCRFATNVKDECRSICNSLPGFTLDEENCILSYDGVTNTGLYPVAIQVEDYKNMSSGPLSSIPVQFLVNIFTTQRGCDSGPVFVSPTPEDDEIFDLVVGISFTFEITAVSTVSDVKEILILSSRALQKSAPVRSSMDMSSFLSMNVSWTPILSDLGPNKICFTAKDTEKISGEQRCVILVVRTGPECIQSCTEMTDGNYQSCYSCKAFVTCSNERIFDVRECALGFDSRLYWNDLSKTCEYEPTTCATDTEPKCVSSEGSCTGLADLPYKECGRCDGYVRCSSGVKNFIQCPPSLEYDIKHRVCDYPEVAKCSETDSQE